MHMKENLDFVKLILGGCVIVFDLVAVIRSGDYYMFEGDSDDDIESSVNDLDTMEFGKDIMTESDAKVGPLEVHGTPLPP